MVRLAIIGAGGWGYQHVVNIFKNKNIQPVAFVDKKPAVFTRLQKEFKVDNNLCFSSIEEVIKTVQFEAAIVSVPNPSRVAIIEQLLAKNIHILMDKPSAHTVEDLNRIQQALHKSKSILMVAQNYRFLESAMFIRQQIESGKVGKVRHINLYFCRYAPFLANGFYAKLTGPKIIAFEMGAHHLDLLNYFIGAEPETIYGRTWHESDDCIPADCHLSAMLTYPNNVSVNYSSTLMGRTDRTNWPGRFEIECASAHIVWDEMEKDRIKVFALYKFPSYAEESLFRCLEMFICAVQGKIPGEAEPILYKPNIKVILAGLAIHESGKTGKPIKFAEFYNKEIK
jgi:predicted dehydrogenase